MFVMQGKRAFANDRFLATQLTASKPPFVVTRFVPQAVLRRHSSLLESCHPVYTRQSFN